MTFVQHVNMPLLANIGRMEWMLLAQSNTLSYDTKGAFTLANFARDFALS
jgi:hypothetical protein